MASWPTQSDYKDSLQNPDTAFRDPDLKLSTAERSPMGVPRARSGAFASVYKMTGPKGTVALKLFNFPNEDRAQRYKAVSDYLEKELGAKKPPCVVKFQYHLEGMRVGRAWYPTLTIVASSVAARHRVTKPPPASRRRARHLNARREPNRRA